MTFRKTVRYVYGLVQTKGRLIGNGADWFRMFATRDAAKDEARLWTGAKVVRVKVTLEEAKPRG